MPISYQYEPKRQKTYIWTCAPLKIRIKSAHSRSLIRIFTRRVFTAKDAMFLPADNEDSDQTARIWDFVGAYLRSTFLDVVAHLSIQ